VSGGARRGAQALGEVHRRGLCHLDVKPANVWVTGLPGAPRALLLDLAFAHEFGTRPGSKLVFRPGRGPRRLRSSGPQNTHKH